MAATADKDAIEVDGLFLQATDAGDARGSPRRLAVEAFDRFPGRRRELVAGAGQGRGSSRSGEGGREGVAIRRLDLPVLPVTRVSVPSAGSVAELVRSIGAATADEVGSVLKDTEGEFVVAEVQGVLDEFIDAVGGFADRKHATVALDALKNSKRSANPRNVRLRDQERVRGHMLKQFQSEQREWREALAARKRSHSSGGAGTTKRARREMMEMERDEVVKRYPLAESLLASSRDAYQQLALQADTLGRVIRKSKVVSHESSESALAVSKVFHANMFSSFGDVADAASHIRGASSALVAGAKRRQAAQAGTDES